LNVYEILKINDSYYFSYDLLVFFEILNKKKKRGLDGIEYYKAIQGSLIQAYSFFFLKKVLLTNIFILKFCEERNF
jgi:hypothetical protein